MFKTRGVSSTSRGQSLQVKKIFFDFESEKSKLFAYSNPSAHPIP